MPKSLQEQLDAATAQIKQKDDEIKDLKQKVEDQSKVIAASDKAAADALIVSAVESGKLPEDQKEWAEKYALSDKEGFTQFMSTLKPKQQAPEGQMFDNSQKQNNDAGSINMSQV